MSKQLKAQLKSLLDADAMAQIQGSVDEVVRACEEMRFADPQKVEEFAAEQLFSFPQGSTQPREAENRPAVSVNVQLPKEVVVSLGNRIWNVVKTLCGKCVQSLKRGWTFLRRARAVRVVSGIATVAWVGAKFGATVALGLSILLSQGAYARVRKHTLRVWKTVRPRAQIAVAWTKKTAAVAYHWTREKTQKTVSVVTYGVARVAGFGGQVIAYGLVVVMWAVLQGYVVYLSARKTLQEELAHRPIPAPFSVPLAAQASA